MGDLSGRGDLYTTHGEGSTGGRYSGSRPREDLARGAVSMMNVKRTAAIVAGLLCALAGTTAQASNTALVSVTSVLSTSTGTVLFTIEGTRSTPPSCGAAWPTRFAFNISTAAGQAMLSTLLTAAASHKPIIVWGTHACDAQTGDTESVSYIELRP
jgi:hypothetical protein